MRELDASPEAFRLLVEFWVAAARDEQMRERFAGGLEALRQMFAGFCADSAADAGLPVSEQGARNTADVMLGLSFGLGLMRVADGDHVSPALLGHRAVGLHPRAGARPRAARRDRGPGAARGLNRRAGRSNTANLCACSGSSSWRCWSPAPAWRASGAARRR